MGRKPCCDKVGLKRGPWTVEEDRVLMNFIVRNGIQCWRNMPKMAGLLRCGKSCRLRWINYLRPDLKRGGFTEEEEDQIIQLHETLGNRWSKIASHFEGRTDNEIKNHWNTKIKKRLKSKKAQESIEPKQKTIDTTSEAPSVASEESNLNKGFECFTNKIVQDDHKIDLIDNNEDDILRDYEIFNQSIEVIERWLNEEAIDDDPDSQSSSGSFQESSLNASMNEFSTELFEKEKSDSCVQYSWFDDQMEPFYGFSNYHLEDELQFSEEHADVR